MYVKAHTTVEHHGIVLCTGRQNHSLLSLQIESGFVLRRRESYSLCSGIIPQTAGELLPLLWHISSFKHSKRLVESGKLLQVEFFCCNKLELFPEYP